MSLEFYYQETFDPSSDLDPVDTFSGTGLDDTFELVYKSGLQLAATITANNVQYYQFNGGFSKDGDEFTLSSVPALNTQIVAPGVIALVFPVFDQNSVPGVSDPRVKEVPFYLGDPDTIHLYDYTNLPQYNGIRLTFQDLTSGYGASLTWVQLACSDPSTGLAMTYAATGEALYTGAIYAYGTLSASSAVGASSVNITSAAQASGFVIGDYAIINIGGGTSEKRKIKEVTGTKIGFFTNLDYTHDSGQFIFDFGRKFWGRVTIPENASNNQAFNFFNIGLRRQARNNSKV